MKNIAIIIIILFINSCTQKPSPDFNYRIDLSKYELKILKKYIRKYGNLDNQIYINGNYLYSDNMDLLKKIKIRTDGMTHIYNSASIIIKHEDNYYDVHKNIDTEKLLNKLNWLDDSEIYNKIPKNSMSIYKTKYPKDINFPNEMLNLSKEDFINKYLDQEIEELTYKYLHLNQKYANIYSLNVRDDSAKYVLRLSELKYEMMIKIIDNDTKIIDVKIETINNN